MAKKEFRGRLPTGSETTNQSLYLRKWQALSKPLKSLGLKCTGFDPGFAFVTREGVHLELPVSVVALI